MLTVTGKIALGEASQRTPGGTRFVHTPERPLSMNRPRRCHACKIIMTNGETSCPICGQKTKRVR